MSKTDLGELVLPGDLNSRRGSTVDETWKRLSTERDQLAIVPGSPSLLSDGTPRQAPSSVISPSSSYDAVNKKTDENDFKACEQDTGISSAALDVIRRSTDLFSNNKWPSEGGTRSGRPSVRSCVDHVSTGGKRSTKKDVCSLLSAQTIDDLGELDGHSDKPEHPPLEPSYPLPLVIFVALLSIIAGLVVTGVHLIVVYAGCPLGVNGCNSFTKEKASKGFFVVKWVSRVSNDQIPEDLVYIVFSVLGACIIATMFAFLPEYLNFQIRGGGTVQALVAVATGERILISAALLRLVSTAIYLGSGGTLGLDGPAIQVCTAVTTFFGYLVGMRSVPTQSLLACLGLAGGFAATFNSPLAGIMFAMEELQHVSSRLSKHIICVILMASIVATLVARSLHDNQPLLDTKWNQNLIDSVKGGSLSNVIGTRMWMLVSVPVGILSSFAGFACSRLIRWQHTFLRWIRPRVKESVVYLIASFLVACIGSLVYRTTGLRGVWGIGYESLQEAFNKDFHVYEYLIVAAGKLVAMSIAVCVRSPGDILEPVLIAGAFLGGAIGCTLQEMIDDASLANQVMRPCLVFGMVGLFASCFRFPLTPVVIVLELMGVETYALVLPAALSGFTAITASNRLFPPLLDEIMHEDDIDLHQLSQEADGVEELEVLQLMEQGIGMMESMDTVPSEEIEQNGDTNHLQDKDSLPSEPASPAHPGTVASRRSSNSTASSRSNHSQSSSYSASDHSAFGMTNTKRNASLSFGGLLKGDGALFKSIESTVLSLSEEKGSQVYQSRKRKESVFTALSTGPRGRESVFSADGVDALAQKLTMIKEGGQSGGASNKFAPRKSFDVPGQQALDHKPRRSFEAHRHPLPPVPPSQPPKRQSVIQSVIQGSQRSSVFRKRGSGTKEGGLGNRILGLPGVGKPSPPSESLDDAPDRSSSMPLSPTDSSRLMDEYHVSAMRAAIQNAAMSAAEAENKEPDSPASTQRGSLQKKNSKGFRASIVVAEDEEREDVVGRLSARNCVPGAVSTPPDMERQFTGSDGSTPRAPPQEMPPRSGSPEFSESPQMSDATASAVPSNVSAVPSIGQPLPPLQMPNDPTSSAATLQ